MTDNPVQQAIDAVGNQEALAEKVGIKQPSIAGWLKKGVVPPRRVLLVERLTGIPREKLNPLFMREH